MTDYVSPHKNKFLGKARKCAKCGKKKGLDYFGRLEMDHIIALMFGGHPWDERNLQALCSMCHKAKTKSDLQILKYWRHINDNDINLVERQLMLPLEMYQ